MCGSAGHVSNVVQDISSVSWTLWCVHETVFARHSVTIPTWKVHSHHCLLCLSTTWCFLLDVTVTESKNVTLVPDSVMEYCGIGLSYSDMLNTIRHKILWTIVKNDRKLDMYLHNCEAYTRERIAHFQESFVHLREIIFKICSFNLTTCSQHFCVLQKERMWKIESVVKN